MHSRFKAFFAFLLETERKHIPADVLEIIFIECVHRQFTLEELIQLRLNSIFKRLTLSHSVLLNPVVADSLRDKAVDADNPCILRWIFLNENNQRVARSFHTTTGWLYAVKKKHDDIVKWLLVNRYDAFRFDPIQTLTEYNRLDILKWLLLTPKVNLTRPISLTRAAENGHLDTLKWLHFYCHTAGIQTTCSQRAMDIAAQNGYLEIVKFLHFNRLEGCTQNAMGWAAEHGHLETVVWLHMNRHDGCSIDAFEKSANNGELAVVKWLLENRPNDCPTSVNLDMAARNGRLDIIRFIGLYRECKFTDCAMNGAAENGNLETIMFLHSTYSLKCPTDALTFASKRGHLKTVIWLFAFINQQNLFEFYYKLIDVMNFILLILILFFCKTLVRCF